MKHLITWVDYELAEIRRIMEVASDLKQLMLDGQRPAILDRKVIGLLFQKPSLRTRVSFESLAGQTGAASLFLGEDVGWGSREPNRDFFPVLASYVDCLIIRAKNHQDVIDATQLSSCPVINGLTDRAHPCQALADLMTIEEIAGSLDDVTIAYFGDANNVAFSLALLAVKLGVRFRIAAPVGYQFDAETVQLIQQQSESADLFHQTNDPRSAAENADFLYTDVWASMGQESEQLQRVRDFADYQVNESLFAVASPTAKFMHCLPARRGEEVAGSVIDSDRSAIIQQAGNRLHAQKGLLVWLLTEAAHQS